ncbi:hypothetical protein [Daejeonia sp. YH14]|uniref:hypothetical protein n=1 Tax=Daejeonia sp. YH14 TaxID=3439042 RepID=UPI003F499107
MKKLPVLLGIIALMNTKVNAQETPSNEELLKRIEALEAENKKATEWGATPYGWVRTDYIFDSRQSAYVREYNLNLYPLDKKPGTDGKDINASGASNFLAITSRVGMKLRGPNVWGATISGVIEGDFFGNTEINKSSAGTGSMGLFRLRHAIATLDWGKTALTFGQTWYPAFITDVYPGVANFNTGIMFNPFGWAGQIKLVQKLTPELSFSVVAYKDREFQTGTASGGSVNSATFNSTMPALHGQLQYKSKNITAGIAAEYQSLKPVIESNGMKSNEKVNSADFLAYFKYSDEKIIAKAYGITGGNLYHFVMLGGFASYTEANGQESYKPVKTTAAWVDIASNHAKVAPGIFFGYTQNNGTDAGFANLYMRGISGTRVLDNVWRASARVECKQNKFNISPELEYTAARWADTSTDANAGGNASSVGNFRAMVRVMYSF